MINDVDIWSDALVPLIVMNFAPAEEKNFEVWSDSIVPLVEIYDEVTAIISRRRVFIF